MKIVIDAMGGDNAPASTVEGAIAAATEWADTQIILSAMKPSWNLF